MKLPFPVARAGINLPVIFLCGLGVSMATGYAQRDGVEDPTLKSAEVKPDGGTTPKEIEKKPAEGEPSLQELIGGLGAEEFRERRSANRELSRRGAKDYVPVLEACTDAYFTSKDPEVKHRLKRLMEGMVVENLFTKPKGFLGITMVKSEDLLNGDETVHGVEVTMVVANSAASAAKLKLGDLIYQVDELKFDKKSQIQTFISYVGSKRAGTKIRMKVVRNGKALNVTATLKARPVQYQLPKETGEEFFERWFSSQLEIRREPTEE